MGEIKSKDYETITAQCDQCGALSTFNRIDDIGDPGPYHSGLYLGCSQCGRPFWVYGDAIEPAYELLLFDAEEHLRAKHYILCVISLAQAWEMFFATYLYSNYLYRPFHRNVVVVDHPQEEQRFEELAEQLGEAIWNYTFEQLRNVLVNSVVEGVRPRTLQESEGAIARIKEDEFAKRAPKGRVEALSNTSVRDVLLQVQGLRIGELRKRVVKADAYRPRRWEVEDCSEEIRVLYRTKGRLAVRTFDEWRAASRST
jgi:hypothetical protein